MRILTWNVNGLRAILKRKYGNMKWLLEDLRADIICFQETKLTKADFDRELALVDGW
jgi:AP endonuclease-2